MTEFNLISKKELLEKYKISYGTLYRWKRQNLIPESWFIKKATVTGQETFFPMDKITERVEAILSRGEKQTLDSLATEIQETVATQPMLRIRTLSTVYDLPLEEVTELKVTLASGEVVDLIPHLKQNDQ